MAKNDLTRVWKERTAPQKEKTGFVANHKCLVGGAAMLLLAALMRIILPDETFKLPAVIALFLLMWNAVVVTWQSGAACDRWLSIGAALLSALMWLLAGREIGFLTIGVEVAGATGFSYVAKRFVKELPQMFRNQKM